MVLARSQKCERMRGSISAELDGELSEFESIRLRGHLRVCASCQAFKADSERFATALRSAPLEPLSRSVSVPSRRRHVMHLRVPVAAAVAVSMIAAGGLFEALHSGSVISESAASGGAVTDNRVDYRAMAHRQQQANFAQLFARRAELAANRIPRHPGFQNP
jgi:predicted anti-sigma-YlaC factor YlaD